MGGAVAGIVVICGTILGVFFIRRNRRGENSLSAVHPLIHTQSDLAGNDELISHHGSYVPRNFFKSSNNSRPIKSNMPSGGDSLPVELPEYNGRQLIGVQEMYVPP